MHSLALAPQGVSRFHEISFNLPVLGFAFAVASLTTVLFGLWPAWQTSRADVQLALKSGSHGSGDAPSAKRTRDWLVISEIALTLTLLIAAALVLKSFAHLQSLQLGYEPRGLLSIASSNCRSELYSRREKVVTFPNALLDKVRPLPGVQSAASAQFATDGRLANWIRARRTPSSLRPKSDGFGRSRNRDRRLFRCPESAAFARSHVQRRRHHNGSRRCHDRSGPGRGNISPARIRLGKRLWVDVGNDEEGYAFREIVGVVARMRFHAIDEMAPLPVIYCSLAQAQRTSLILFVRAVGGLNSLKTDSRS